MANPDLPTGALQKLPRGSYGEERRARKAQIKATEAATMRRVKAEDGNRCRVPHCKSGGVMEVSHQEHRGMGGNPAGDRTEPKKLITLCVRHHDMWDRVITPDLDIYPMTDRGLRGPCEYHIDGLFYARERTYQVSETRSAS